MDKETMGKRIREQRKKQNLTLDKFSESIGIGLVYLGEIERGVKMPSVNTLIKIINALDISADVLLRYEMVAAKPYVLDEITERMKDLTPPQLKMVSDVLEAMLLNMGKLEKPKKKRRAKTVNTK